MYDCIKESSKTKWNENKVEGEKNRSEEKAMLEAQKKLGPDMIVRQVYA